MTMRDGTSPDDSLRQKHVPNSYDVSTRETGIDLLILNNHKNVGKIDAVKCGAICFPRKAVLNCFRDSLLSNDV